MPPLGDLITQLPVLHALRASVPALDVEVCVSHGVHGLLDDYDWIARTHIRKNGWRSRLGPYVSSWREPFDLQLYLRSNPAIKLPRLLMRAKQKMGPERYDAALSAHVIARRHSVLRHVLPGAPSEIHTRVFLRRERTGEALEAAGAGRDDRILCVSPGASQPSRMWPVERWAELLRSVADAFDVRVVLGSPRESAMCAMVAEAGDAISLAGSPLTRIAALLGVSAAFVGNDSGLGHLAAAQECATLTLGLVHPYYRPWRGHALPGPVEAVTVTAALEAMAGADMLR